MSITYRQPAPDAIREDLVDEGFEAYRENPFASNPYDPLTSGAKWWTEGYDAAEQRELARREDN